MNNPFVLGHGSWHTGFVWFKTEQALRQRGVTSVYAPSLSGMATIDKPADKPVSLHTHINDVIRLIVETNLNHVVLVGHRYGGFVIAGVAEAMPERIAHLVFLDVFITEHGQSLSDLVPPQAVAHCRSVLVDERLRTRQAGAEQVWLIPPSEPQDYGVSDPRDIEH